MTVSSRKGYFGRQGDVVIAFGRKPKGKLTRMASMTVAYGEATGHKHRFVGEEEKVTMWIDESGHMFARVDGEAVPLVHDTHKTIVHGPGWHEVWRQRTYTPEEIRNVND